MRRSTVLVASLALLGLSLLPDFKTASTQVAKRDAIKPEVTPMQISEAKLRGAVPCSHVTKIGPQTVIVGTGYVDATRGDKEAEMQYDIFRNGERTGSIVLGIGQEVSHMAEAYKNGELVLFNQPMYDGIRGRLGQSTNTCLYPLHPSEVSNETVSAAQARRLGYGE